MENPILSKSRAQATFQHIQRSTLILIAGMLLGNALSFIKSLLIATYYGTSAELDAYFLSLAPLDLISGILLGAIQTVLIPRYLELMIKRGKDYAFAVFVTFSLSALFVVIIIVSALLLGSSTLASYLGPGFNVSQVSFLASLLKLSTLLFVFNILNDIGRYLFNAHCQFLFSGFIPLVSGVCSLWYLARFSTYGVSALMYGLIFGMVIQTGIVLYAARRFLPEHFFLLSPLDPEIKHTFKLMSPLLLGASFGQTNMLIDQMMASTLPAGSIAALNYANKLHGMLTQMFIMGISSVVLPFFARQAAEHDIQALKATFFLTIKRMSYVLLPLSVCIILMSKFFVQTIFQRGAFSAQATAATAGAWLAYTLGLPVMAIGILTARMYNVLQENTTLMYVSGGGVGINIFFNWVLMKYWGHIGIALSTSLVYMLATGFLLYRLPRKIGKFWD